MESVSGCLQMLLKCDWDGASGDVVSATRQAALRPRGEGLAILEPPNESKSLSAIFPLCK